MCVPWGKYGSQRTNCRSLFSTNTMWVIGTELRAPGLGASDFTWRAMHAAWQYKGVGGNWSAIMRGEGWTRRGKGMNMSKERHDIHVWRCPDEKIMTWRLGHSHHWHRPWQQWEGGKLGELRRARVDTGPLALPCYLVVYRQPFPQSAGKKDSWHRMKTGEKVQKSEKGIYQVWLQGSDGITRGEHKYMSPPLCWLHRHKHICMTE